MDSSLELLIKLGFVGQENAQAAQTALDNVKQSTKEVSNATENLAEQEKKASEITELLHHNHRALHQIFHLIGSESAPMLGHALTGALYGPIGLAIAAGAAFEYFKKSMEESEKAAEALGEELSKPLVDSLKNQREEVDKLRESHSKLIAEINSITNAEETFSGQLKKTETAIEDQKKRTLELVEAREKLMLSLATTPEQKEAIEREFGQQKTNVGLGAEQSSVQAQRQAIEAATRDRASAQTSAEQTQKAAEDAERKLKDAISERDRLRDIIENPQNLENKNNQKRVDDAQKKLSSASTPLDPRDFYYEDLPIAQQKQKEAIAKATDELNAAQAAQQNYTKLLNQASGSLDKLNMSAAFAEEAATAAAKHWKDVAAASGSEAQEKLNDAITKLTADITQAHKLDLFSSGAMSDGGASIEQKGLAAIEAAQRGEKLSKDQMASMKALMNLLDDLGLHGREIIIALEKSAKLHETFSSEVRLIRSRLEAVEKEIENAGNKPPNHPS